MYLLSALEVSGFRPLAPVWHRGGGCVKIRPSGDGVDRWADQLPRLDHITLVME